MNGEWLGSRAIRVNWANQKTQTGGGGGGSPMMGGGPGGPPGGGGGGYQPPSRMGMAPSGMSAAPMSGSSMGGLGHHTAPPPSIGGSYSPAPTLSYEAVAAQTPEYNATVYVGNLIPFVTQADLIPLFQGYGYIVEIRMQSDRGFAFVKLDSHHNAAMAITHLQNQMVHGRGIKCSWGKDKAPDGSTGAASPAPPQQYQAQMVCLSLVIVIVNCPLRSR
jgi:nucleolysin TIA-1/TIAR